MKSSPRLPRLLLTNDDGFDAPGLAVLSDIAKTFSDEVWVIAPEHDQSGTGQSLSIHNLIRCWPRGERRWSINGTPADCVALALGELMGDKKPSLILSGINSGSNLGDEVSLSGTLGAAFTGMLFDIPSIALSQACKTRQTARWDTAAFIAPKIISHFLVHGWKKDTCLSINIPDLPAQEITGFSWARQSQKNIGGVHVEKRQDPREQNYYWLSLIDKDPILKHNCDAAILNRGEVAVTALGHERSVEVNEPSILFEDAAPESEEDL